MRSIKILNQNMEFVAEIDDYEYLRWTRRFRKYNLFELHINRYKHNVEHLQAGNYIVRERAGLFQAARIEGRELKLDKTGKKSETWKISGADMGLIFSNRIALHNTGIANGYDEQQSTAETVMKHYVNVNCINPTDPNRRVENLINGVNQNRGPFLQYKARFQTIAQVLEELSLAAGLGWEVHINLDKKQFIFDVIEGKDRTPGQMINNPVIFSPEFDNVKILGFFESSFDVKNVAIVAGQGEGEARTQVIVGTASGIDRREIYIDARDLQNTEAQAQRGNERLSELKSSMILEFEVLQSGPFKYLLDYDLGDIVHANYPGIASSEARIIEVEEEITARGESIKLIVGKEYPDLVSVLKRDRKNTLTEVYR